MTADNKIEFSVVVPTYNRANLLPRALESILVQSHPAREIIVVDDGSSDATAVLLRREYPQVRYHYQRHNGVSAARNLGIRHATTRWIAFLDSDDRWHPQKLHFQAVSISNNPRIRLVHCNEVWLRNGSKVTQPEHLRKFGGSIFSQCLNHCVIAASSAVIRRDVFNDVGFFDESLKACEDYDMWLRITANEPVGFVEEALVTRFSGHGGQLSTTRWLDSYRIRALSKLLALDVLTFRQRREANLMLEKRRNIMQRGIQKRRHQRVEKRTRSTP